MKFVAWLVLVFGVLARAQLRTQLITDLAFVEPWRAHLFHADTLWVGRSSDSGTASNRVEAFSSDGARLASIPVPHSVISLHTFGENSVLAFGKSAAPWKSHYSVVTRDGLLFGVTTRQMPEDFMADGFGGNPSSMFFNDVGDARVFSWNPLTQTGTTLSPRVRLPGQMLLLGNTLWIVENNTFDFGDENLVRLTLSTQTAERTFRDFYRRGLFAMEYLEESKLLAVSETFADQVLLIDTASNQLTTEIPVPGLQPRAMAQMGHCLIVASEESRKIQFYNMSLPERPLIQTWDLSVLGNKLRKASALAVDNRSGKIFVRSAYICPVSLCDETMSSVFLAEETDSATYQACLR